MFMQSLKNFTLMLALLTIFSFQNLFAQTTIAGKVTEALGQDLSFANVLIFNAEDTTLVKGDVTDLDGRYQMDAPEPGNYLIGASMIGYETTYSSVFQVTDSDGRISIETLSLAEEVAELNEVQVVAKKPLFEQKIDRLVVNVENSITSAGTSALEVLERSPGVIVNRQNDALSLIGKDGVVVMINGKVNHMPTEALVQMLAGMSSDNIEKIELITTPPANFDAEGNAGFINIVLRKNADFGANGSYSLSAGYGRGAVSSASINFNYRKQKVNFFGSYSFLRENQEQDFTNYRKVVQSDRTLDNFTASDRDPTQLNHNARLGLDLQVSEKTVIGALIAAYDNKWTMDAVNDIRIEVNQVPDTLITLDNIETNQWRHFMGNLNLQHNFSKSEKLNFDVDYLYYHDNNPNDYINRYFDGQGLLFLEEETRSRKETPIEIVVGKLDYSKSFGEKLKWETGLKGTMSKFTNDVSVEMYRQAEWVTDFDLTAKWDLTEDIAAAYTAFEVKLDDKSQLKAGLRYEFTDSNLGTEEEANIVDREFGRFFPSIFVSRQFNDNHSSNISYSRRITRPTFNDMAPFVIFMDPNTFFSGNSALQPSISDNFKVDYRFKTTLFSLQYTHEDDAIARFQNRVIPETNKQLIAAENMENRKTLSFMIALPVYLTDWWEMQNNIMGTWQEVNTFYDDDPIQVRQKNAALNSFQTFKLKNNFSMEISGFYRSPTLFGVMKMEPMWAVNFGLQKQLKNDKGSLKFSVDDIFNSLEWDGSTNLPEQNLVTSGVYDFSQRTFRLSYSRNFGNKKLKGARNRATGSQDEQQRVN